jgi:hypothetical protein
MRHAHWLAAAGLLIGLSACSETRAEEAGPAVSRSYPVTPFSKIEVSGPYDVSVTTGGQPNVQASGGENLLAKTVVEVVDGTLRIHPEKRKGMKWGWSSMKGENARFAVSVPMLTDASVAGSGDIAINKVAGERFAGSIAGSGGLKLQDVQVRQLGLEIAGSGKVEGRGQAAEAKYEIAGSGDILAAAIASERMEASIAGSGNIEAHARSTANVDIAGAGNVKVTGGAKCKVSKAGVGNVSCS